MLRLVNLAAICSWQPLIERLSPGSLQYMRPNLKWLPRGTYSYHKLRRPAEIEGELQRGSLRPLADWSSRQSSGYAFRPPANLLTTWSTPKTGLIIVSAIRSETRLPPWVSLPNSKQLRGDMRSNHAGETGAVCIYRGILRVTRDPGIARFAKDHLATEEKHLSIFEAWLPKQHRSFLLPLWRLAGYLLGMIAASLGPRWVFTTIDAVENLSQPTMKSRSGGRRSEAH